MDVAFFAVVCSAAYGVSARVTQTRQVFSEHRATRLINAEIKGCYPKELPKEPLSNEGTLKNASTNSVPDNKEVI